MGDEGMNASIGRVIDTMNLSLKVRNGPGKGPKSHETQVFTNSQWVKSEAPLIIDLVFCLLRFDINNDH